MGRGGVQNPNSFLENDAECAKTFDKNLKKNGSEIFMLKTPQCHNSTNTAQITFGVVGIDFWAQITSKIKLWFFLF
jgi:hypothetical protein